MRGEHARLVCWRILFHNFILENIDLIFLTWENQGYERWASFDSSVRSKSVKQWANFSLRSNIALALALFWHLEAHFHPSNQLIRLLLANWVAQLWILSLLLLIDVKALWDIESIWTEKSVDFLFKFWYLLLFESILKYLGAENEHGLIKVPVILLIGNNFGFELHVRMDVRRVLRANAAVLVNNVAILIRHFFSLIVQFLLLWGQHLRNRKTALPCLLF